jgi:hypothetical protein
VHFLRYVVKRTVTDSPFNTQASCSKCPPPASIPFLTLVTRELLTLRSTIQAHGGHFEQLAWVLNSESVTVHLTTYLNKCTMLHFFKFIYCDLKTYNSWTVANWARVYDIFDSKTALELNPEVVTLTPGTPCIYSRETGIK